MSVLYKELNMNYEIPKPEEVEESLKKTLRQVRMWLKPFYEDKEILESAIHWKDCYRKYKNPNYNLNSDEFDWRGDAREWLEKYEGRFVNFFLLSDAYEYDFTVTVRPDVKDSYLSGIAQHRIKPIASREIRTVYFTGGTFNLKTWKSLQDQILKNEMYKKISSTWKLRQG